MKNPRILTLLALVLLGGVQLGSAPLPKEEPKPEPKALTAVEIADKLQEKFAIPGWDDPKTTLTDVLDQLTKRTGISFEINTRAFADAEVPDVDKFEIAQPRPFPANKNTTLARVLRRLLDRVGSNSRGIYLIREDGIEITTANAFSNELGRVETDPGGGIVASPTVPLVYAALDKKPLEQALKYLAERTGFTVVLDARAGEKSKTPVSATFKNVPLDTAVRLLADMSELRSVLIDNTLYVTSPENADRLITEQNRRLGVFDGFGGIGGLGGAVPPGAGGVPNQGNIGGPVPNAGKGPAGM